MEKEQVDRIRMRGHHLFCIIMMQNWTLWGPKFWENILEYKKRLENPDLVIEIVPHCCDTCAFCPRNLGGKCELYDFREGANMIDLDVLNRLGLKVGDEITAGELMHLIKERYTEMPSMCVWGCGVTDSDCTEGLEKIKNMEP